MPTVQQIKLSQIDPDSSVNVRRQGVERNVEQVKSSIQQHGYWPEMAIVGRPHPNSSAQYDYEHITGQCRFKACLELGLDEIPSFVLDLNDNDAIQRSWTENEARGDLTASDKAYWTERIFKQYNGAGHTAAEAITLAAEFLGVTVQTVQRYYSLVALPEDLKQMVDQGILAQQNAVAVVRNTYDGAHIEQSQDRMRERANWILSLNQDRRRHAIDALEGKGHSASIDELDAYVTEKSQEADRVVQFAIPRELHGRLMEWGRERGLDSETAIVSHMVADVLRRSR